MITIAVATVFAVIVAACTPGEGPESIPLPTSPDTTTTTSTTTTSTTTTTTTTTIVPPTYEATIRRTTDGVAHILAADGDGAMYGQGWVSAEDHGCTLIDQVLKVYGERSANLGPGPEGENIESDFAWRAIGIAEIAEADFAEAPATLVDAYTAFAAGWNDHLAATGRRGLIGWCGDTDWVRPLEPVEIYAYSRSVALLMSSGQLAPYLSNAQPPSPELAQETAAEPTLFDRADIAERLPEFGRFDLGSNGWAVGRDRTADADGLLVANPHLPWEGELRMHEVQLTVPGSYDIYGANLVGVPGIGIGFTSGVAWTHTVSAGHRFTAYSLALDPADPTAYLVDGVSTPMTPVDHEVEILRADGTIDTEMRTLWRSEYGPLLDLPGIGWNDTVAVSYRDANLDNNEFIEQYQALLSVESLDGLVGVHEEFQGNPMFNVVATGADGTVWYADTSATPNLSAAAQTDWVTQREQNPFVGAAFDRGMVLLDGSVSTNDWVTTPGARDPGLIPWSGFPMVERTDYVFNSNESYWVPSAEFTLDASSVLQGERDIPQSMRSRQSAAVLGNDNALGLAGDDNRFTGVELRDATFDNTAGTARLLRASTVQACRATPIVGVSALLDGFGGEILPAAFVDVSAACDVLDEWDGRYDLDRAGAIVWREMMAQFTDAERTAPGPLFAGPFNPLDATTTPSQPNPDATPILIALGRAVQTVEAAGFGVDSTLGAAQFTERTEQRIPLHGGTDADGVTNIVEWSTLAVELLSSTEPTPVRGEPIVPTSPIRGEGYPVNFGTSFVMTVAFGGAAGLEAWALLTYGETGDRGSSLYDQQMVRFSEKNWRRIVFTDAEIAADPNLTERTITR
ncbi:MAG: penicillin acylase family protein [Actinomycetota bacterium]